MTTTTARRLTSSLPSLAGIPTETLRLSLAALNAAPSTPENTQERAAIVRELAQRGEG